MQFFFVCIYIFNCWNLWCPLIQHKETIQWCQKKAEFSHTHTHLLMYCLLKCCDSIGGVPMGTGWLMMLGTSYAVKNIFLSNAAQRLSGDVGTRGRPSDRTQGWSRARTVWPTSARGRGYNLLHCPTLALLASNRDATVWRLTILVLSM